MLVFHENSTLVNNHHLKRKKERKKGGRGGEEESVLTLQNKMHETDPLKTSSCVNLGMASVSILFLFAKRTIYLSCQPCLIIHTMCRRAVQMMYL
jgi:hypothetical protein